MLGAISRTVITAVTRWFFLGDVIGLENLPAEGPYLLVANHASFFDHFILASIIRRYRKDRVYYLTKKEAFEKYLSRVWHISVGCIPLNRNSADTAAFRTTIRYLHEGKIVCIYPEGTRSFTGHMLPGKQGALRLAIMAKVPIVPVGMKRTFDILPKGRMWPRFVRAEVYIGQQIRLPEKVNKKELDSLGLHLMESIADLCADTGNRFKMLADENSTGTPTDQEMIQAACEYNERGIRHTPNDPLNPNLLHLRAKYICEELLKKNPTNSQAHFELGRAIGRIALFSHPLKKMWLAKKSKKHFQTAIQISPDLAHAHYALGMWHLSIPKFLGGNKQTALQEYTLAAQLAPEELFIRIGLAQCQQKLGLFQEARQTLIEAMEVELKHSEDFRRRLEVGAMLLRLDPNLQLEGRIKVKVG